MKILILGTGPAQFDAIKYCKDVGFEVCACSNKAGDLGQEYADRFALIDIRDVESVRQYVIRNGIDVLYSVGSDVAMPTISLVSEELGLPCFISSRTASICQSKELMRNALGSSKGNISFKVITAPTDMSCWQTYPCIVKPVDSQGQRGVFFLRDASDFPKYYSTSLSYSHRKAVIVEEYVDGPEVSVNAYAVDGKLAFYQTSDRIVFDQYPGGLVKEHRIPSKAIRDEGEVCDLVQRVIAKLKIQNGPAYFQIKLDKGYPKLIEVAARLDGCHLWKLIREYARIDLLDCTFKHLVEGKVPAFKRKISKETYYLKFMSEKPGKKVDRSKYEISNPLSLQWYYEQGEEVEPVNGFMEKIGYVITPNGTACILDSEEG